MQMKGFVIKTQRSDGNTGVQGTAARQGKKLCHKCCKIHVTLSCKKLFIFATNFTHGVKVFTVKKELLDVGKEIVKNSFGHEIPIYNRERTICDLVRSRSRFEIQDYQTALKTYIGGKGKDLNRLMEYAKLFHVDEKIRDYMEVML